MSTNNPYFENYKYQTNTGDFRYSVPVKNSNYTITEPRVGRFSTYLPKIYNRKEYLFYLYNYVFQDQPDDTNINFFDSNTRKFRTRSSVRNPNESSLSRTYNKLIDFDTSRKYNFSENRNTFNYNNINKDTGLIQSRFDNEYNERRLEKNDNTNDIGLIRSRFDIDYNKRGKESNTNTNDMGLIRSRFDNDNNQRRQESNINTKDMGLIRSRFDNDNNKRRLESDGNLDNKGLNYDYINSEERDKVIEEIKRERDEFLGIGDYSPSKRQGQNLYEEKPSYKQFRNEDPNINFSSHAAQNQNLGTNKNLEGSKISQNYNQQIDNERISIKLDRKDLEISKENEFSQDLSQSKKHQKEHIQNVKYNKQPMNNKQFSQFQNSENLNTDNQLYNNNQSQRMQNSKNNQYPQYQTEGNSNIKSPIKSPNQLLENSLNKNQISQSPNKENINKKSPIKSAKKKLQDSINNQISQLSYSENANITSPINSSKQSLQNTVNNQISKSQYAQNMNVQNPVKNTNQNSKINQYSQFNNLPLSKSQFNNYPKEMQYQSPKNMNKNMNMNMNVQNSNYQKEMQYKSPQNMNKNMDMNIQNNKYQNQTQSPLSNRESNVSVVKKQEEKTIVIVPGHQIEPRNVSETFENPIEEIIENPDGTRTSLIKQTKIITTTESIPIEEHKIKAIEGAPELPMIKQKITYEYKTVTLKDIDRNSQDFDGQNNFRNSNIKNNNLSPNQLSPQGYNQYNQYGNEEKLEKNNQRNNLSGEYGNKKGNNIKQSLENNNQENNYEGGEYGINNQGDNFSGNYNDNNLGNNNYENYGNNEENIQNKKSGMYGNQIQNVDNNYLENDKTVQKTGPYVNQNKKLDNNYPENNETNQKIGPNANQNLDKNFVGNNETTQKTGPYVNQNQNLENNDLGNNETNRKTGPYDNQNQNLDKNYVGNNESSQKTGPYDNKNIKSENNYSGKVKTGHKKVPIDNKNNNINNINNNYLGNDKTKKKSSNLDNYNENEKEKQYEYGGQGDTDQYRNKSLKKKQYENKRKIKKNSELTGNRQNKINVDVLPNNENLENYPYNPFRDQPYGYVKNNSKEDNNSLDILPKGFKNKEEFETFLDEINKKGDKVTPEEKQRRLESIEDIFNNISIGGKNSEENLEKLGDILGNINENDKKEILQQLSKNSNNNEMYQKLLNILNKRTLKGKGKEKRRMISDNLITSGKKASYGGDKDSLIKSVRYGQSGYNKGFSKEGIGSGYKGHLSEYIEVKDVNPLKFDGLFLEITKYNNEKREKNPFEGPSPYCKFYQERRIKIKQKINNMASGEIFDDEIKLDENEK